MTGFAFHIADRKASEVPIADALSGGAELTWVHLADNGEEAQGWLRDTAQLDEYVVDALTATETRPRCEKLGHGAFVNLRGRSKVEIESSDLLASVRIWAERGRVFSVTRKPMFAVTQVREEVVAGEVHDPGDLIAAFAAAITEDLDPEVAALGDSLDDCEEALDPARVFELRRGVTKVRTEAISYRRFLHPQRQALEKLATLPGDWLEDDDRLHLSAAADRAARMAEELDAIRDRAALMHEALTDLRAEQIDSRALLISVVAMVFLPLTFITGLYGMNVDMPGQHSPYAFDIIVGMCALIAGGVTALFVRQHWFRG